ncbi:MAG TPA: polysaccharide deacetylase family protein [Synergistales bacterium]|nr:polysaccharide deacetylase family protein [Synergistales bacterium]HQQ09956.1 polysaccharide deacetylase family protein [Synergistales bacterium]
MITTEPEILAVTYHYLSGAMFPGPGVLPFGPERFIAQVEFLARSSHFLSLEDLSSEVLPDPGGHRRYTLLTFDDGLADQFEVAWPILRSRGIPGAFFPCTAPLKTGKLLHVHRMHALRSAMPDKDLLALLGELSIKAGFEESSRVIGGKNFTEAPYPYDTPEARTIKSLLNYTLPISEREALSEMAFRQILGEEAPWAKKLYMGPEMLCELSSRGCLGTHTHLHRPLSRLDREGVRWEIVESLDIIEKTTGRRPDSLSYPYGNHLAVSGEVFEVASECGLKSGFTTERRHGRIHSDRLSLPRFDAEDIPLGKRPVIDL